MNMTTESRTYTYEHGEQETVTLLRDPLTPHGHALLKINYSDGRVVDCYVNAGWLRDRLDDLGEPRRAEPRPLTPDAITDEMVGQFRAHMLHVHDVALDVGDAAEAIRVTLATPARPEGAEDIEVLLFDAGVDENRAEVANYLAARLNDPTRKEA